MQISKTDLPPEARELFTAFGAMFSLYSSYKFGRLKFSKEELEAAPSIFDFSIDESGSLVVTAGVVCKNTIADSLPDSFKQLKE